MDIVTAKCLILVVLFLSTALFSMFPIVLASFVRGSLDSSDSRCKLVVSLLSCFAGGVFMATGLLDLFPEVDEALRKASWSSGYPVSELLISVGFFLVLIVEQVVLYFKERALHVSGNVAVEGLVDSLEEEHQTVDHLQGSLVGVSDHPLLSSTNSAISIRSNIITHQSDPHSSFRTILLAAALSLHSIFEGLAIGLQSDTDKLLQIFIAVLLHKSVIAFSLGLNLVQSELRIWTIIQSNLAFSLASPIGLGVALGLEEYGHSMDSSTLNGILQGLACGTFLYVTFFEVLPHELNIGDNRLLKVFAIIIGFAGISAALFLDPDNQSVTAPKGTFNSGNLTYPHLM